MLTHLHFAITPRARFFPMMIARICICLFFLVARTAESSQAPTKLGNAVFNDTAFTGSKAIHVDLDYAYAISSSSQGTGILTVINISDPGAPAIQTTKSLSIAQPHSVAVLGNYAFISDANAGGGLHVMDISDKVNPVEVTVSMTEGLPGSRRRRYDGGWTSIRAVGHHLFVAASGTLAQLMIVDVSKPLQPELVGECNVTGKLNPNAVYTGAQHLAVQGNFAYVSSTKAANGWFAIIDISNVNSPELKGFLQNDPSSSSNHMFSNIAAVDVVGSYAFIANKESFTIVDVSASDNPNVVSDTKCSWWEDSCKEYDDLVVASDFAFLAVSKYIVVADISDKANPLMVGEHHDASFASKVFHFQVQGDYLYASGESQGAAGLTRPSFLAYNISFGQTPQPTAAPTPPTTMPTSLPTAVPTEVPTAVPTAVPTEVPTAVPTAVPTEVSIALPTARPTAVPKDIPTARPTARPTVALGCPAVFEQVNEKEYDGSSFDHNVTHLGGTFSVALQLKTDHMGGGDKDWSDGTGLLTCNAGGHSSFGITIGRGRLMIGTGVKGATFQTASRYNDGQWHHIVASRNGSSGVFTLWVDGVKQGSLTSVLPLQGACAMDIGRNAHSVPHFIGWLRIVRAFVVPHSPLAFEGCDEAALDTESWIATHVQEPAFILMCLAVLACVLGCFFCSANGTMTWCCRRVKEARKRSRLNKDGLSDAISKTLSKASANPDAMDKSLANALGGVSRTRSEQPYSVGKLRSDLLVGVGRARSDAAGRPRLMGNIVGTSPFPRRSVDTE